MQKPKLNGFIITSLIINIVLLLINLPMFLAYEATALMLLAILVFWLISLIGAILITIGQTRIGAYMVFAGCLIFVPIGGIGLHGARKVLKELEEL